MQDAANAKEHRRRETAGKSLGFAFQSRAMSATPAITALQKAARRKTGVFDKRLMAWWGGNSPRLNLSS